MPSVVTSVSEATAADSWSMPELAARAADRSRVLRRIGNASAGGLTPADATGGVSPDAIDRRELPGRRPLVQLLPRLGHRRLERAAGVHRLVQRVLGRPWLGRERVAHG